MEHYTQMQAACPPEYELSVSESISYLYAATTNFDFYDVQNSWGPNAEVSSETLIADAASNDVRSNHCVPDEAHREDDVALAPEAGTSCPSASAGKHKGSTKVGTLAGRAAAHRRRVVHPDKGEKQTRFFCSVPGCGANFTAKHNYQYHVDAHDQIKRFGCEACKSQFPSRNNLKRHASRCKGRKAAHSA
ncbi:hypothetical protein DFJ43DRAFT_1074184 [Lentinula guzmanii]|uniref:C2H2-type domain-containing protein n=1 Tax=Lentinula guzmanii TaxID=2804957 RepID=A0AA38MU22_9AGAR|nr:hypothetical protein DFJ43DRAFT_1074184 [Lentinula guzmanii]